MILFKSKPKINLYARLSYTKQTRAEVTKNLFKDNKMLDEVLSREGSFFKGNDFTYIDFENDDDKVFKIFLKANIKDAPKYQTKLESDLKDIFDCNDVEIARSLEELHYSKATSDTKKKINDNNLAASSTNNLQNSNSNVSVNTNNSQETIDSLIKDKNQSVFGNQTNIANNNSQTQKDNSSYQKSPYEKDGEEKSTDQPKEFKYF